MNKEKTHSIFFATRAIAPPWDEASKNMVLEIAKRLDRFSITLLTYKNQKELLSRPSLVFKKIYPLGSNNKRNLGQITFLQKCSFLSALMFSNASIYHFYFTAEIYSSKILRIIRWFKRGKYLQTIATPIKIKSKIPSIVFGDVVVVQSDYSLNLLNNMGIKNVSRIYPAIDTEYFKPGIDTTQLRKQLDIADNNKVVLYCGNYYLGCNDDLINIILLLSKREKPIKFILACRIGFHEDLLERERMKTVFCREGIIDNVIFLEKTENILQLIEISDIHIYPAQKMLYKSDIPLVLLESLAMEKPIIITDISPLNEIMKEDVGEVIPVGDTGQLLDSILKLLNDDITRKAKGKRGREIVIREFGLNSYVEQYSALYDKLLGNSKIQPMATK
tara:strand:+ start:129 stop:1298 length:1170 start_codon:yes stop_codon:yes gene_type:complete